MLKAAPPFQMPGPQLMDQLKAAIVKHGEKLSGPFLGYDASRQVFLVAVIEQGVILHWQLESCHDKAECEALMVRYRGFIGETLALAAPARPMTLQ
jgi:hypothetical protein